MLGKFEFHDCDAIVAVPPVPPFILNVILLVPERADLKYTLAATDSNGGTHVSATNVDVPETAGTSQIGSVGKLPVGKSHTYQLTLNFIDTGYEQDSNQGKEFVGKIEVASISA